MPKSGRASPITEVVPGHVYDLPQLGAPGEPARIQFVRRSGGAVQYDTEWPGVQTQSVIRACIARTKYLMEILPCAETGDAIHHLRMALFVYEARAWRRKYEKRNRTSLDHDDTERPRPWRPTPYDDVPFSETEIELRPVGADGHIRVTRRELTRWKREHPVLVCSLCDAPAVGTWLDDAGREHMRTCAKHATAGDWVDFPSLVTDREG